MKFTGELLTNKLTEEDRNGRLVYNVPCKFLAESYTKGDYVGCVMNSGMFEPNDIQKSLATWNKVPATLEHPMLPMKFGEYEYMVDVSASDPEAQLTHSFGAWLTNVERVYNKKKKWYNVTADIIIDVNTAKSTQQGRRSIGALKKGGPLSCSIGCTATIEFLTEEEVESVDGDFWYIVRNIEGDHLALLLDSEPAHSVEEGTGINMSAKVSQLRKLYNNGSFLLTHRSISPNLHNTGEQLPTELLELLEMSKKTDVKSESTVTASTEELETEMINEGSVEDPTDTSDDVEVVTSDNSEAESANESDRTYTQSEVDKLVADAVQVALSNKAAENERNELVEQVVKSNIVSRETALTFSVGALQELLKNVRVATPVNASRPTEQTNFDADKSILSPKFNRSSKEKTNA